MTASGGRSKIGRRKWKELPQSHINVESSWMTTLTSVGAGEDCHSKDPKLGGLTTEMDFLAGLEAKSPRSRSGSSWFLPWLVDG